MTDLPETLRCISIRQPWASLVVDGVKTVENRTWRTEHRGPLLIHAGQTKPNADVSALAYACLRASVLGQGVEARHEAAEAWSRAKGDALGAVIGVVELVDVAPSESAWALPRHKHWRLARAMRLTPTLGKGRLQLWAKPTADLDVEAREQLRAWLAGVS